MYNFDKDYFLTQFKALLDIDSTTGMYREIQNYVCEETRKLGFVPEETRKGGMWTCLGGEGEPLVITAHLDDIGFMVRHINADGTLNICPVGGIYPFYSVMDNVRVYTFDGRVYTGTVCRTPNSVHATEEELRSTLGDFRKNVCVVLDEPVKNAEDTKKLGIETGNIIAPEPRFTESNGYLKSRFVDDKACAAALLCVMKYLSDNKIAPKRKVYAYFGVYEEIGHGTTYLPADTADILAVDIAVTGPEQNSEEHKVSIFLKDSRFPYNYEMSIELIEAAKKAGLDYVTDVMTPHYGTDADGSILAGYDIRHAAIGPGCANSHGYERTHMDGIENTYALMLAYIL